MTREWVVVANYWKVNNGWTHEEEVDRLNDYMTTEMYVNSLDEDTLATYFSHGHDAVQFDIIDEDGNKVSDYWVDRADALSGKLELLAGELHEMIALGWTDEEARENEDAFFERIGDYADGLTKEEVWEVWQNALDQH